MASKKKTTVATVSESVGEVLGTDKPKGKLGKLAAKKAYVPSCNDPREELRKLVIQHRNWTRKSVSVRQMASKRINRTTGDVIECDMPADRQTQFIEVAGFLSADAKRLETSMLRELRKIPIYREFLSKVFGFGPVACAYLISEVDVVSPTPSGGDKKISSIRRYCGLAVIDGRLERPRAGQKNAYNKELRVRIYQAMSAMWKNAAKKTEAAPFGTTTKYLEIWRGYKHRMLHSDRYDAEKNTLLALDGSGGVRKGAKAVIHSTGWHKAADVLIEDLYTVWRALEGRPVWPSYYAAKLGYAHGGQIAVNAPKMLTLEEALATVGYVGSTPLAAPDALVDATDTTEDDNEDIDDLDLEAAQ